MNRISFLRPYTANTVMQVCVVFALASIPARVAFGELNDTGIDWSGSSPTGNSGSCAQSLNSPQDCQQGRDATYDDDSDGHAGFSFTKISSSGDELPASASNWACVRDNVTGLLWEAKTDEYANDLHYGGDTFTWYNSDSTTNGGYPGVANGAAINCYGYGAGPASYCNTEAFIARVNAEGLCGYSDWRLPTREELRSIVDYTPYLAAIDHTYFPNTDFAPCWSSSPAVGFAGESWGIWFGTSAGGDSSFSHSNLLTVRLVRNEQ